MPVYDEDSQDPRQLTGSQTDTLDPAKEQDNKSMSREELADSESLASSAEKSSADKSEETQATDHENMIGSGYRDDGKKKARLTRKQGIIGMIFGVLITGGLGISSILTGPLELIHKGQLLQQFHFTRNSSMGDDRSAKFFLYALSGKASRGRLGVVSNKIADKVELRLQEQSGLKSMYDRTTGRFVGYQIIDPDKAKGLLDELDRDGIRPSEGLNDVTDNFGREITDSTTRNQFLNMRDDRNKSRRAITRLATKSVGLNGVSGRLSSRMLIRRGGVNFHPLKDIVRSRTDNYIEWRRDKQRALADEDRTGDPADLDRAVPEEPTDPDAPDADIPEGGERSRILGKIRSIVNTAKGPLIAAGVYCAVDEFNNSIDQQNYENMQQAMRVGMRAVTTASQIQSGQDLSFDMLSVIDDQNYDEETRSSWASDPGIQAELGEPITGVDYNTDSKPGSKEKPQIFQVVGSLNLPKVGVNGVDVGLCEALNAVGGIPPVERASATFESILNSTLSTVGIPSTEQLTNMALDYFSTGGMDLLAQGAKRGGIENIGARLGANDQFLAMGGREMTGTETIASKQNTAEELRYKVQDLSLFDRYLNPVEANSLIAHVFRSTPHNRSETVTSFANLASFRLPFGGLLLSHKVSAATNEYDYGFPLYGFSEEELSNQNIQDPFANGEYVEQPDRLEALNNQYGNECFGMTISRDGRLQYGDSVDYTKLPEKCKSSDPDLLRYRFYIFDMVNAHSLACFEGEVTSCDEIGFGKPGTGGNAPVPTGEADPGQDTSSMQCPAGTEDGDVHQDYGPGGQPTVKIRICGIPGAIVKEKGVNVSIASQTLSMIEAMRKAGMSPTGSSFRSYESQQVLRSNNCPDPINSRASSCSPPTAKAGSSMHEVGLAIDFQNMCYPNATCRPGSNDRYDWLMTNAVTYGFKKLSSEAWHWSVTGN